MTIENSQLVSVIIPCYNQAHYLGEAIESILNQTYPHYEIIVIDDGSPDNASEVAARYPYVRCIRQPNRGLPNARNAGFGVSKGGYLIFLDSDDRLLQNALEVGVRSLKAFPECGYVAGQVNHIAHNGSPLLTLYRICTKRPDEHYLQLLSFDHTWTPAVTMFRRSAFEAVGGYNASPLIKGCEDYDICLRIAQNYPVYCHNEITAEYRLHELSMSRDLAMMLKNTLDVIRPHRNLVKGNKHYEEAYNVGVRRIRESYGEQIIEQIRSSVRTRREWKKVLNNLMALAWYYPKGLLKHGYRKLCCVVKEKGGFSRLC